MQAQRERLENVRAQYEQRCAALAEQTREVAAEREHLQAERDRLREERAQLVQASIEAERVTVRRPEPAVAVAYSEADPDVRWWSLQLGFPLTGPRPRRVPKPEDPRGSTLEPHGFQHRGVSSAGRAPALQAGGHRFDPGTLHSSLTHSRSRA